MLDNCRDKFKGYNIRDYCGTYCHRFAPPEHQCREDLLWPRTHEELDGKKLDIIALQTDSYALGLVKSQRNLGPTRPNGDLSVRDTYYPKKTLTGNNVNPQGALNPRALVSSLKISGSHVS